MLLYLVRHAHAVSEEEDPARPLSLRGVEDSERVARFLAAGKQFSPVQVWHSSLQRARQTAQILVREGKWDVALVEKPDLLPENDPAEIAQRVGQLSGIAELAIVGHEPHLSGLATLLVRGKSAPVAIEMKKGAVLALENSGDLHKKTGEPRWIVLWHIHPGLIARGPGAVAGLD